MAAPTFQRLAPKIMIYRDVPPDAAAEGMAERKAGASWMRPTQAERRAAPVAKPKAPDVLYIGSDPIQDILAQEAFGDPNASR